LPTTLRWGILGTGNIAKQFCTGLATASRGRAAAVGSRTDASAGAFGDAFKIPNRHGSYEAMLADSDVDAVYVSLPNSMHHQWTIAALKAGKHVLCEKPFAVTVAEAEEMFDAAAAAGRVVIEAFMYRCHPLTIAVKKAVDAGVIGKVKLIRTSFSYRTTKVAGNVRFQPGLAGGCLMDVGCYCINFSRFIAGAEPVRSHIELHRHASGVDDAAIGTLVFPGDTMAIFSAGMAAQADNTATISGTDGYLEIPVPWKPPSPVSTYVIHRQTPPKMDGPAAGGTGGQGAPGRDVVSVTETRHLYGIEADAFADSVLDGVASWISRADTIGTLKIITGS
jgi:xylose dehydrogenase (NAD/NADP)